MSFAVDVFERTRQAAQSMQKIDVVEVLGEYAGWLVLQSDIAVCADAVQITWDLCRDCGKCGHVCPTNALHLFGQEMTVDQIISEAEQDSTFYRESGGGITLSGGECLLQADFSAALLEEIHRRGVNTAIETAVNVPWESMANVLPHVDTVLHDIKLTDPERHKKWTGVGNTRIRANFKKAYETFPDKKFIARTPLISDVNDDEEVHENYQDVHQALQKRD